MFRIHNKFKGISNVLDSLKYFIKEEIIEDVVCVNCSLHRLLERLGDHLLIHKNNEEITLCLMEQITLVKSLIERMKRMLIDHEDLEQKIMEMKRQQIKKSPEFERILAEPYFKKKGLVRSHNEIIKFPVNF